MYYILESENPMMIGNVIYESDTGFGLDFLRGMLIDEPKKANELFVEIEPDQRDLPDYLEFGCVPVVNTNFLSALTESGIDNYQAFPVNIKFENSVVSGYSVLNVVGRVSAIDVDGSDTKMFKTRLMRMTSLKFKNDIDADLGMFRAHEYPNVIFLSEKCAKSLLERKVVGCKISVADGWSDEERF